MNSLWHRAGSHVLQKNDNTLAQVKIDIVQAKLISVKIEIFFYNISINFNRCNVACI